MCQEKSCVKKMSKKVDNGHENGGHTFEGYKLFPNALEWRCKQSKHNYRCRESKNINLKKKNFFFFFGFFECENDKKKKF